MTGHFGDRPPCGQPPKAQRRGRTRRHDGEAKSSPNSAHFISQQMSLRVKGRMPRGAIVLGGHPVIFRTGRTGSPVARVWIYSHQTDCCGTCHARLAWQHGQACPAGQLPMQWSMNLGLLRVMEIRIRQLHPSATLSRRRQKSLAYRSPRRILSSLG